MKNLFLFVVLVVVLCNISVFANHFHHHSSSAFKKGNEELKIKNLRYRKIKRFKKRLRNRRARLIAPAYIKPATMMVRNTLGSLTTGNTYLDRLIESASQKYNIDPVLIYVQMGKESGYKGKAVSPKGARCFMQIMPDTARGLGVTNLSDPVQCVNAGVKYLRQMLNTFNGSLNLALAAYNAGPGAVLNKRAIPPYRETRNYVYDITQRYATYQTVQPANEPPVTYARVNNAVQGELTQNVAESSLELIAVSAEPQIDVSNVRPVSPVVIETIGDATSSSLYGKKTIAINAIRETAALKLRPRIVLEIKQPVKTKTRKWRSIRTYFHAVYKHFAKNKKIFFKSKEGRVYRRNILLYSYLSSYSYKRRKHRLIVWGRKSYRIFRI